MNPGSADQALDSVTNVDIEWMQHFYAGLTKLPEASRSSSAMDEELEMEIELINIINTAKKRNCMITAPANNSGRMGSCYLAAGMKPELDMRRIAASLISSAEATSVTTRAVSATSCGMISNSVSAAANTSSSGLQKYSSALPTGAPLPAVSAAAASSGGLCRGSGAVKVKKKRVRPSRRVPTTVLKTDTSNFKAMVEHFTGVPTTTTTTTTQESTTSPPATSSSPPPTSSASSPSFSKPLPHPAVCKIPNSTTAPNVTTSAATATSRSPPLPSSNPTSQSVPALPSKTTVASTTCSADIPNSGAPEEITMSLIDTAFFDELWS